MVFSLYIDGVDYIVFEETQVITFDSNTRSYTLEHIIVDDDLVEGEEYYTVMMRLVNDTDKIQLLPSEAIMTTLPSTLWESMLSR